MGIFDCSRFSTIAAADAAVAGLALPSRQTGTGARLDGAAFRAMSLQLTKNFASTAVNLIAYEAKRRCVSFISATRLNRPVWPDNGSTGRCKHTTENHT